MEFTDMEKEVLERALYAVESYYSWDDETFDYEKQVLPALESLRNKLGLE